MSKQADDGADDGFAVMRELEQQQTANGLLKALPLRIVDVDGNRYGLVSMTGGDAGGGVVLVIERNSPGTARSG